MTREEKGTGDRLTMAAEEVVEVALLLPTVVFSSLEAEADRVNLTVAQFLRLVISNFLRPPPGEHLRDNGV